MPGPAPAFPGVHVEPFGRVTFGFLAVGTDHGHGRGHGGGLSVNGDPLPPC
ncbi:hypothetical protein ABZT47_00005 [Sphaerisporangium sp. NPDC005289]|uniref:hypothetical protein n=1 Tax=Sphaerisporangium sp. NPDC005289 TaxID=3155247 RepID=UPI0033B21BFD